jgi:hypothetical protein
MSDNRKSKAILDKLTPDQQRIVFEKCEPLDLAVGVKWIAAEFGIDISDTRLSVWLEKKRKRADNDAKLEKLLGKIEETSRAADPILLASKSHKALLAAAEVSAHNLLQAQLDGDIAAIKFYSDVLTTVVKPALKVAENETKKEKVALDAEKFKASIRTKLETGLDALAKEIQGNAKALKLYNELRGELKAAA